MATRRPSKPEPARRSRAIVPAVVAVVVIAAGLYFATAGGGDVANRDSRGSAIVAFGDSLTAGYGAAPGEDYPSQLATIIGRDIVNAGRSGDTTAAALGRIDEDVLSQNPRLVIVGLGGNDFLRGEPIVKTEENLRAIVRKIQAAGSMVVLLGFEFPSLSANYAAMYERVAEDEKCLLVDDVMDGILSDAKKKSDEIHPNGVGYRLMAERVADPVAALLE